jgi:hypothetical protein
MTQIKTENKPTPSLFRLFDTDAILWNHLEQWYSTFFVRLPSDVISLQLCTPKVGV